MFNDVAFTPWKCYKYTAIIYLFFIHSAQVATLTLTLLLRVGVGVALCGREIPCINRALAVIVCVCVSLSPSLSLCVCECDRQKMHVIIYSALSDSQLCY